MVTIKRRSTPFVSVKFSIKLYLKWKENISLSCPIFYYFIVVSNRRCEELIKCRGAFLSIYTRIRYCTVYFVKMSDDLCHIPSSFLSNFKILLTWFSNVLNCHSLIFSHKAKHREDEKSTVETCSTVTEGKYDGISTLRKKKKNSVSDHSWK